MGRPLTWLMMLLLLLCGMANSALAKALYPEKTASGGLGGNGWESSWETGPQAVETQWEEAAFRPWIAPDVCDGMNWFAYSAGDPINLFDPLGLGPADSERYTWIDGMQDGIGTLGFIPGLGAIPDGVNAAIYLFRGKWSDAMFSGIAVIPFGGDLVAGVRYADKVNDVRRIADGAGDVGMSVGYHATHPDVVPLIQQNGFKAGTAPGRLGSGGTYVNNTRAGAIAEFQHHNPGVTPSVLRVEYNPGINASTTVAPRNYVENLPFYNVDSISAPSVRLPGTTNTNVLNGSVRIAK